MTHVLTFVALLGAAAAGIYALGRLLGVVAHALAAAHTLSGRVERTLEIVEALPPADALAATIATVSRELTPNGGESVKDHVADTSRRFKHGEARFSALEQRVSALEQPTPATAAE